jgi:nucleoside-diphosphate-sugar epimerase
MGKILVTGALGQIGSELVPALRARHGPEEVVASDIRMDPAEGAADSGPFEQLDCTKLQQIQDIVRRYDIDTIYHLAALLSAVAEEKPQAAWSLNMGGLYRVLEVARQYRCGVFFPSSIGAFGPSTPPEDTPQETIQRPTTMYGVTKVASELLCDYYASRFGVDTRGLRLPGLISFVAPPGGGTTDYAVDIFYQAIRYRHYTCFLGPDTRLDMMYMPDAVRAMLELMDADAAELHHRNAYNITAMNFTPAELAAEIRKHIPDFEIDYEVDPVRQAIADSWPDSIDDGAARTEWRWQPAYDLAAMTGDMLERLAAKLKPARA